MNIKLITILSVAIALVSALSFVSMYKRAQQAPETKVAVTRQAPSRALVPEAPSPDTTSGDASVTASVKIGNPDDVTAQVTILK